MVPLLDITTELMNTDPDECLRSIGEKWNEIPLYGRVPCTQLKEGQIVRFRGMIQDMANPVFYFSKFEVMNKTTGEVSLRHGKYLDSLPCIDSETLIFDSEACESKERRMYYMISVPSLNEWAQIKVDANMKDNHHDDISMELSEHTACKRTCEEIDMDSGSCKRLCSKIPETVENYQNSELLPSASNEPSCLLMLYDIPEGQIKLNDVIEVSGFLYQSPLMLQEDDDSDMYTPPSPLTPRLHVVSYRKVNQMSLLVEPDNPSLSNQIVAEAISLRSDIHTFLTELLLGDALVADYLICHLLSQVYFRDEAITLGKLCLNIFNFPIGYSSKKLYNILSTLLPKTCYVPLTIDNLNTSTFLPGKNYKTGRLDRGILQLSDHTHLIIDETKLTDGKLEDKGVRNVYALKSLINRQALDYDFTYYTLKFTTDIPVLIFSQSPSILPSDARLPLKPEQTVSDENMEKMFQSVQNYLNGPLTNKIRLYLSIVSNITFNLPEEFQTNIQEDFVAMRQSDSTVTAEDLHELLVLARFMSMSYGQNTLNKDIWELSKSLITGRKSRVKK